MLKAGDRIVHPQHGAGTIEGLTERITDGENLKYYVFRPMIEDLTILIPTDATEKIGIRKVCSKEEAKALLKDIRALPDENGKNRNQRNRENLQRIISGDPLEVAKAIKSLSIRQSERGLPPGEKQMLDSAKMILASELAFALEEPVEKILNEEFINSGIIN